MARMIGLTPEEQPNEETLVAAQEALVSRLADAWEFLEAHGFTEDDLES